MAAQVDDPREFNVELYGQMASVSAHTIKSAKVFHIIFCGGRPSPLLLWNKPGKD